MAKARRGARVRLPLGVCHGQECGNLSDFGILVRGRPPLGVFHELECGNLSDFRILAVSNPHVRAYETLRYCIHCGLLYI